jgi:hypothetical protein
MPGLTYKRADPGADGPRSPGEGEQPKTRPSDLAEPVNQAYEFDNFSFEIDFLVVGAPLARI